MIWKKCNLYQSVESGEFDVLGNAILTDELTATSYARTTPWSKLDLSLEGRTVTVNDRKFLVRIPFAKFPKADKAEIDGEMYRIKQTEEAQRFTLLYVERYKE